MIALVLALALAIDERTLPLDAGLAEFELTASADGTLFVQARSEEFDPHLRIYGPEGDLIEDGDSGGGTTSFVSVRVRAGDVLGVEVTAEGDAARGSATVKYTVAPHLSDAGREAVEAGNAALAAASLALAAGDHAKGRGLVEEAVERLLEHAGETYEGMEVTWLLGAKANELQDLRVAERAMTAVLEWRLVHYPRTHDHSLLALQNVAGIRTGLGRAAEAYPLAVEAAEAFAERRGPEDVDALRARTNVGVIAYRLRRLDDARDHFAAVYEVFARTVQPSDPNYIMAVQNLTAAMNVLGEVRAAHDLLLPTYRILDASRPAHDAVLMQIRANLGAMKRTLGDLEGSRELQEKAYGIATGTLPADSLDLLRARQNLALLRKETGDYLGALRLQEDILATRRRLLPEDHPEVLGALEAIGITRRDLGDERGAHAIFQEVYERTIQALGPAHSETVSITENLAVTLADLGRFEEARDLRRDALRRREELYAQDSPEVLLARSNLAVDLCRMGEVDEARRLLEEVYRIQTDESVGAPSAVRHTRQILAMARYYAGDTEGAIELEEIVLEDLERRHSDESRPLMIARLNLSVKQAGHRDLERGRALIVAALAGVEARMRRLSANFGERGLAESNRDAELLLPVLLSIATDGPDQEQAAEELHWVSAFRGLAETRARMWKALRAAATQNAELERLLIDANVARQGYLRALETDGEARVVLDARATMEGTEEELLRASRDVEGVRSLLREGDLRSWLANLPVGGAAVVPVFYNRLPFRGEGGDPHEEGAPSVAVFVATPEGAVARLDLGGAEEILALCSKIRADPNAAQSALAELGARLAPIFSSLDESVHTLFVSPDGGLAAIPWAALPVEAKALAIDRYDLRYIESLAALDAREGALHPPSLLLVGDVDYDAEIESAADSRGSLVETGEFRPLANSLAEVEAIGSLFQNTFDQDTVRLISGDVATRAQFLALAESVRLVHLSTHGFTAAQRHWEAGRDSALRLQDLAGRERAAGINRLLLSFVVFAGANSEGGGESALLSAMELAGLDLTGCELAVLSACETNVGPRYAGEAATGFNRALQLAGARSTITSLWRVPDKATALFFQRFYAALWRDGMDVPSAFRAAQLHLRDQRYEPRAWSGFVLYVTGAERD